MPGAASAGRSALLAAALVAAFAGCGDDPEPRAEPPVVMWAVGDGTASRQSAQLVRTIEASKPRHLLYLGDVYEDGTAREFRTNFDATYGRLARITSPTLGNHESATADDGYRPYWRRAKGRPVEDFYALRAGRWQILSLNSEIAHDPASEQVRWLREQVAGGGTCRIAFWHRPRFSAGRHGDNPDTAPLWRALRGRARIVLGAHDHDSQRLKPRAGITSFVAGAGGRDLYEVDATDDRLAFSDDKTFAALKIVLRDRGAETAFVAADGRVLDRSRVRC